MTTTPVRPRNDPAQYDDLVAEWWRPAGEFAALHWLAEARARLVPPPGRPGALLLDLACGGGLMAGRVPGYRHVGVDLSASAVAVAATRGIAVVRGDVAALPVADRVADVVLAGEIFEHVDELERTVAEIARVLRPGGILVCDTINATWWARFSLVTVGERLPGGPPRRCHDPGLFVPPERLRALCAAHGIALAVSGLRFSVPDFVAFLVFRRRKVRMLPTRSLAAVYQGVGRKAAR
ncbi:bifunctional 3-demethylubiquinone 3-O-methyltransferase/2-octaprenyl-6-hydroxy phenol methylase [soil metagenome]|jgi:2-polyprenyl-6-hydroxyphenyl methylase/3-demethylubiquinone-9 3-methyltransferase